MRAPSLGVVGADGTFIALPAVFNSLLAEGLRHVVFEFLAKGRAIAGELRTMMLGSRHFGGFSAHNRVRVAAGDRECRINLAGHMLRAPMRGVGSSERPGPGRLCAPAHITSYGSGI